MLRLLGKAPWAVADQLLISATNFATMVLLARGLSQEAFGSFTLIYSVLLFANNLQFGLITQPHNILAIARHGEDYTCYTTSTAVSQLFFGAVAALAVLAAWAVGRCAAWSVAPLLLTLAPSIVSWQLQEFVRRILYTEGRLAAAFVNDSISYGGQALAIAALWWLDGLTAPLALGALAATSAIAATLGGWQIRGSLAGRIDPSVCAENWHFGKWLAAEDVVGTWLSSWFFVYLGAAVFGRAAAAILGAVHTIFGPARVLAYAMTAVLPIHFARSQAVGGRAALYAQLKVAFLLAVPLLGGYCLLVAIFAEPLMRLVYGEKYAGNASLVALYAICTCSWNVTMIIIAALSVRRLTRLVFMNRLCVGLIATPVGCFLILTLGIHGVVLSMIATSLATCLLSWRAYRRDLAGGSSPDYRPTRTTAAAPDCPCDCAAPG